MGPGQHAGLCEVEIQSWSGRSQSQRADSLEAKGRFKEPLKKMSFQKWWRCGRWTVAI